MSIISFNIKEIIIYISIDEEKTLESHYDTRKILGKSGIRSNSMMAISNLTPAKLGSLKGQRSIERDSYEDGGFFSEVKRAVSGMSNGKAESQSPRSKTASNFYLNPMRQPRNHGIGENHTI